MSKEQLDSLTDDQAAVYDRQLRVWGVETQRKLTAARVLLVGFGKLAAEVAKNITLAGVGHVTLLDSTAAQQHVGANFLIPASATPEQTCAAAAAATLQAMNPLVSVTAAAGSTEDKAAVAAAIKQHDLVIAAGLSLAQAQQMDAQCREAGVGFMAAAAAGPGGWFFVDLQEHSYMPKGGSGAASDQEVLHYSSLAEALATPRQLLPHNTHAMYYALSVCAGLEAKVQRRLTADDLPAAQQQLEALAGSSAQLAAAQQLLVAMVSGTAEFAPVCAVLGGVIANNVVTAVSANGAPLNNILYYALFDGRAIVETQPVAAAANPATKTATQQQQQQQQQDTVELDLD